MSDSRDITVSVAGQANVEAEPDIAYLYLQVDVAESSPTAATDSFAHALAAARALLEEFGSTYRVESTQSSAYGKERRTRHRVTTSITATVTDLGTLSPLVERVLDTERLQISHVQWALTNMRELRRRARTKALTEAREAADDYAAAVGLSVSQILTISDPEAHGGGAVPLAGAMFSRAGSPEAADRPEIDLTNREPVRIYGSVIVSFLLGAIPDA